MPAAVLENTPQEAFGRNLANRRCSERQRSQQVASTAAGKGSEGKWRFTRCASSGPGTAKHRSGHGTARWYGKGPPDLRQPPDGTGRRNGRSGDESRFLREPPVRNGQPDAMSITMRWHSRCDGTRGAQQSITAAGRLKSGNSDRPKSFESRCGERGAGGNTGPICCWGVHSMTLPTLTSSPVGSLIANS